MRSQTGKTKLYFLLGVLLVVVGLAGYGIYAIEGQIQSKNQEFLLEKARQEARSDRLMNLSLYKQQAQKIEGSREKIDILMTEDRVVEVIKTLEDFAQKTGNSIAIDISDEEEKTATRKEKEAADDDIRSGVPKDVMAIDFQISLTGTYQAFILFLHQLEHMDQFNIVHSIRMEKKDIAQDAEDLNRQGSGIRIVPFGQLDYVPEDSPEASVQAQVPQNLPEETEDILEVESVISTSFYVLAPPTLVLSEDGTMVLPGGGDIPTTRPGDEVEAEKETGPVSEKNG